MAYKKKTKKVKRHVDSAIVHVKSTFNNTLVTVTTVDGDVLVKDSSGRMGYKGTRKGTPFAASQVGASISKHLLTLGINNLEVNLQGPGSGRDSVVRSIQSACSVRCGRRGSWASWWGRGIHSRSRASLFSSPPPSPETAAANCGRAWAMGF